MNDEMFCVLIVHDNGFAHADSMPYERVKEIIGSLPEIGSQFDLQDRFSENGIVECEVIAICNSAYEAMNIEMNAYLH